MLFRSAAIARRQAPGRTACFLSGGLDSSTVTGLCAKRRPGEVTAFTIGFDASGYDEMDFARSVATHFNVEHAHYYVTPQDIVSALPSIIGALDGPFGNASAVPTYFCARQAAEHGFTSIMAGDGGDELFGGNSRYTTHRLFDHYHRLPGALRRDVMGPSAAARIEAAGITAQVQAGSVTAETLQRLPTMAKADARTHVDAIVWREVPGGVFQYNTGEPLYPHQRELLQRVFGVPIANEYGCRDGGFIGHEAPGGQMLMVSESNFVEILNPDGAPVPVGDPGELVLTGLTSAAQPFIRYRTGDIVTLSPEPDRGGRGLHVIADVAGRSTDFLVREDGTIMHALAVIYVLRAIRGVAQFKCIQHTPTQMEILVVPGPDWQAEHGPGIVRGLRARLGENLHVDLKLQDDIPPEASGKHRYVVSHVKLPGSLGNALANVS